MGDRGVLARALSRTLHGQLSRKHGSTHQTAAAEAHASGGAQAAQTLANSAESSGQATASDKGKAWSSRCSQGRSASGGQAYANDGAQGFRWALATTAQHLEVWLAVYFLDVCAVARCH